MKVLENKGVDLNEKEFRGTLTLDAWHCGWQFTCGDILVMVCG